MRCEEATGAALGQGWGTVECNQVPSASLCRAGVPPKGGPGSRGGSDLRRLWRLGPGGPLSRKGVQLRGEVTFIAGKSRHGNLFPCLAVTPAFPYIPDL